MYSCDIVHDLEVFGPNIAHLPVSRCAKLCDLRESFVTLQIVDRLLVVVLVWCVVDRGVKAAKESCYAQATYLRVLDAQASHLVELSLCHNGIFGFRE